ncbi:MAG: hypothetical protein J5918_06030 [Prevotella sp.]|jgi:hypothetical protein|nr:hypothetical protein [Prevotella sp.]
MSENKDKLSVLLSRFYEAQTSEQEEERLKQMIADSSASDEELTAEEKEFFSQMFPPEGFEQRMAEHIDSLTKERKRKARIVDMRRGKWIAGIAASVAIVVSVGLYLNRQDSESIYTDTYNSPEEAYQETKYALSMFSNTLNKGYAKLEEINRE